ncbi:MAG TPA: hypothetical protein VK747_23150, partial [Blastocatellia bacterium]|nr:hypothetical protein [Blastocatellia bacterium]
MKVLFSASLFGLMLASSAAAQSLTYKTGDEIQGKPQTIRVEVARFSEKSGTFIEGGRVPASEFNYDSSGRMTRSLVYDFKGALYAKYSATFDDRGNPTEEVYYSSKDSILDKMLYTYDSSGRLIQKEVAKAKTAPRNIIVYKYDNSDRISGKSRPEARNSPGYDSTYAYDDQGRKIEVIRYDQKGQLILKSVETFNGQGRLAEKHVIFGDKSQEWRLTLVYDSKGNL